MKAANYLFTSYNCPGCVPVKNMINEKELDVNIVSIDDEGGQMLAAQFNVRSLPTLVIDNGKNVYVGTLNCINGLKNHFE